MLIMRPQVRQWWSRSRRVRRGLHRDLEAVRL